MKKIIIIFITFTLFVPFVHAADFYKCTYSVNNGNSTTKWATQTACNNLGGTSDSANKTTCAESVLPDANGVCGGTAETSGTQITPSSNTTNGNLPAYVPLEPLPGFDQSGQSDFSFFLNALFKISIAVGAIIALAMLVYSGIVYMVSGAIGTKSAALKRIQASLWGLLLLIASWLLLYTINPRLVGCDKNGTCPPAGAVNISIDDMRVSQTSNTLTPPGGNCAAWVAGDVRISGSNPADRQTYTNKCESRGGVVRAIGTGSGGLDGGAYTEYACGNRDGSADYIPIACQ